MTDEIDLANSENISQISKIATHSLLQKSSQERETIRLINETKEIVERLMQYAIKNPIINITPELLKTIIPLLRKESEHFTDEDEVALWSSYNDLTELVKPATDFSLIIAEQLHDEIKSPGEKIKSLLDFLKFWKKPHTPISNAVDKCHRELRTIFLYLISTVILYVLIQGYCNLLSDALIRVEDYQAKWMTQYKVLQDKRLTKANSDYEKSEAQLRTNQLATSTLFLASLTDSLFSFHDNPARKQYCVDLMRYADNVDNIANIQKIGTCISFQKQYAFSTLSFLANYILPLVLGVLGATAFIVRNTLEKLETDSYLPSAEGKLSMRLCLGGLLGVMSGIFISSDQKNLLGFNLNLIMIALVMGYSVEVAFSLFDSIVERMRDWTRSLKK